MSYQIKSTPFFRRMVSTSKKNGQLQKLKEEYERIKEFNDRSIEMKMRQVRLKRLFREIEDIKEATATQWKRRRVERAKTVDEIRMETLQKAKELGTEYSKVNGLRPDRSFLRMGPPQIAPELSNFLHITTSFHRPTVNQRKALIAKRINYGNEWSRKNLEQFKATTKKPLKRERSSEVDQQKNMLKQRLTYGNSCSSEFMSKIPRRSAKHLVATETSLARIPKARPSVDLMIDDSLVLADRIASTVPRAFKTFEELESRHRQIESIAPPLPAPPLSLTMGMSLSTGMAVPSPSIYSEQMHEKAKEYCKYWHSMRCEKPQLTDQAVEPPFENQLRAIPNDLDLPQSDLKTLTNSPNSSSDSANIYATANADDLVCDDDGTLGEQVLKIEQLNIPMQPSAAMPDAQPAGATAETADTVPKEEGEEGEPEIPGQHSLTKYAKMFQPYVRRVTQKEVFEFGVQQLRSIFEHQCE